MLLFGYRQSRPDEVENVFAQSLAENHRSVDRMFLKLFVVQWIFGIVVAYFISPLAWEGAVSSVHTHVWAAIFLGGLIAALPILFALKFPGRLVTRLAISTAQLSYSALLIHLMGGRIEAHFHVFVSLALLAAYRDRTVFLPAVLVTVLDHLVRGFVWPQSVFGIATVLPWRPFEHGAWVLFETMTLCFLIRENLSQLLSLAQLQYSLQGQRDELEVRVAERTQELSNAKVFQERILNSIDAEICILDERGAVVFVNDRWREFSEVGKSTESSTGMGANFLAACQGEFGPYGERSKDLAVAIQDVQEGLRSSYSGEFRCDTQQRQRWIHVAINSVTLDGCHAIAVVHVDVTAMQVARSRAASLAKLILDSPDEVFIMSKETLRFVEVNHGACANLGYSREELLEMTIADIEPEFTKQQLLERFDDLAHGRTDTLVFETNHQRKDQSTYLCSLSLHCSVLEEQEVVVAFATDLSERKRLEDQLRQSQKLESVGQLAAGVAHEINTPMQCVFGNVEFLQSSFDRVLEMADRVLELPSQGPSTWDEADVQVNELRTKYRYDYLRKQTPAAIQEAADASARVISIIRAMKIMSHPGSAEKTATDLHDMIENAATITRSRWKNVAEVKFEFDPGLSPVELLPAEISQVFINMIVNAADAISEKLGDEPEALGEIRVATAVTTDGVRIEVSDNGAGMPEAVREKIFDPFFTTKEVGKGTGQGLSITHHVIVNQHGGTLEVRSEQGQGTTFVIQLPMAAPPSSGDDLAKQTEAFNVPSAVAPTSGAMDVPSSTY